MAIIMHIDMDAFFASIEEREHPELRGKPIIVGADPKQGKGRGVVSTANYEARKYGIKSGMSISKAWKICREHCKDAAFLRPRFELYEKESEKIMEIIAEHGTIEQVSIDEAFLDVSKQCKDFEQARALALLIKNKIYEATGLTCSIGIAENKLLAKIASDLKKPDGLTIIEHNGNFLARFKPNIIPGIGKKTLAFLRQEGIKTIADLQKKSPFWFLEKFGKIGIYYYQAVHGIDKSKVEGKASKTSKQIEFKSIGKEITFDVDTLDEKFIFYYVDKLCEAVWDEVRAERLYFKAIEVKIRYQDYATHTHEQKLLVPIDNLSYFSEIAKAMIKPFLIKPIRLIGIRAKHFVKEKQLKLTTSA
ncbi:MAG: DNA polymerase IV [Candidatus Pacearchaeota archaeon]